MLNNKKNILDIYKYIESTGEELDNFLLSYFNEYMKNPIEDKSKKVKLIKPCFKFICSKLKHRFKIISKLEKDMVDYANFDKEKELYLGEIIKDFKYDDYLYLKSSEVFNNFPLKLKLIEALIKRKDVLKIDYQELSYYINHTDKICNLAHIFEEKDVVLNSEDEKKVAKDLIIANIATYVDDSKTKIRLK